MSELKNRIKKIEQIHGKGEVNKYMCLVSGLAWKAPAEIAKGYKIQPYTISAGGTGGEPFYIPTFAGLKEFEARADVNLNIIEFMIVPASQGHSPQQNYPADYIPQGMTPPDLLP